MVKWRQVYSTIGAGATQPSRLGLFLPAWVCTKWSSKHSRTSTRICHNLPLFSMHAVSNKYSNNEQHKSSLINAGQQGGHLPKSLSLSLSLPPLSLLSGHADSSGGDPPCKQLYFWAAGNSAASAQSREHCPSLQHQIALMAITTDRERKAEKSCNGWGCVIRRATCASLEYTSAVKVARFVHRS